LSAVVLVDTCSFIDYFRGEEESILPVLAARDQILLSKVVRLELLKGTRRVDRRTVLNLFEGLKQLPDFPPAKLAEEILFRLHGRGLNLGFADLLILADAASQSGGSLTAPWISTRISP
jgi:predicted nucleic acid-binding protein